MSTEFAAPGGLQGGLPSALASLSALPPDSPLPTRLDFAALLDQRGRLLQVHSALPELALIPERVVMIDAVDAPFELTLDCIATSTHFELKRLVGQQLSVRLLDSEGAYRPWHGYVAQAMQLGSDGGAARYRLVMHPWLSLLAHRQDSYVFQDKTALQIVEEIFADYPQAHYRFDVSEPLRLRSLCTQYRESDLAFVSRLLAEEGLSYRFEHLDGDAAARAEQHGQARHCLVIADRLAPRPDLGATRFTSQHVIAKLAGQRDAVTAFSAQRRVASNAVTRASWNYKQLVGSAAEERSLLDNGALPTLEDYDGSGAYRYENAEHARRAALDALAAHELGIKQHEGQGSTRHFAAGCTFSLIDHPLFGANTSAAAYAGALGASRARPDNAFTLTRVEHHAANNLGAQAARLLQASEIEHGAYRNRFSAVPAAAPLVPRFVRRPRMQGCQSALVVGLDGEALTTERNHRVKIQYPWQRGERPLPGGLAHQDLQPGSSPGNAPGNSPGNSPGNAPGNDSSGTWVRVALPSAGANHGAVFVPRIGTEVLVEYLEGDIDRPIIVAQLYNGADTPPFAAGVDSGVNHPGVISGVHVPTLDGSAGGGGYGQWLVDDSPGQLRMRLLSSHAGSELSFGHLIQQSAGSAQRGPWRGSGFEAITQGWATLRAARGLLVTSTARQGTYASAHGTQMDAAEALAQLKGANALGLALDQAATPSRALGLKSHRAGEAIDRQLAAIDPKRDGKHAETVNGQKASKPSDGRTPGAGTSDEPVEAFATPLLVLDTPSRALWLSEAGVTSYAGQDTSLTAQGDLHQAAAHTHTSISGKTTSLYTAEGGIKAFAAHGPVSLRAHTDELHLLAQQAIEIVSVNDEIRISAPQRIELVAGRSGVVLDGGNIELSMPGGFEAKGVMKEFLGGESRAATPPHLPNGLVKVPPNKAQYRYTYHDGEPMAGVEYVATLADGSKRSGRLDAAGFVQFDDVPAGSIDVVVGADPRSFQRFKLPAQPDADAKAWHAETGSGA